jgi:hypothetical protein
VSPTRLTEAAHCRRAAARALCRTLECSSASKCRPTGVCHLSDERRADMELAASETVNAFLDALIEYRKANPAPATPSDAEGLKRAAAWHDAEAAKAGDWRYWGGPSSEILKAQEAHHLESAAALRRLIGTS